MTFKGETAFGMFRFIIIVTGRGFASPEWSIFVEQQFFFIFVLKGAGQ